MKNLILFDHKIREALLPLTFYRPISEIRVGIITIREKWEKILGLQASHLTQDYLSRKYPLLIEQNNLFIAGNALPTPDLVRQIKSLKPKEGLLHKDQLIAANIPGLLFPQSQEIPLNELKLTEIGEVRTINRPADIFLQNEDQIKADFDLLTQGRTSQPVPESTGVIGKHPIFIEEGAVVWATSINTTDGPAYIGKNALIMEGTVLRGPVAFCESAVAKMGAKIYKGTTIGPWSKVGGEISNSVFFGYSNKGHDGYLGNSVIAEWCNFGAGSSNSNLKNNYSPVKVWSYVENDYIQTHLIFHGLIMGDHSKCSINSMFNTGTVVGVHANVATGHFPPKFIPSFSWNVGDQTTTYELPKAIQTAQKVMARRGIELSEIEHSLMEHIFRLTTSYRKPFEYRDLY
ncbi:MAG TPA: glucose-1-phosphate thymidylyltransferase [Saprospiraceae bacterium]|nr:glucose-1-phosphate thymidylyltransferase [Saprospiraceae bacterium]